MNASNVGKGLVAGFAATIVLSALMMAKAAMGLMPDLDVVAMLSKMTNSGPPAGWLIHFFIGTVLWGGLFALLEASIPGDGHR